MNKESNSDKEINEVSALPVKPSAEEVSAFMKKVNSRVQHIENVQRASRKLGEGLAGLGEFALARRLIQRAYKHDNSKFQGIEWTFLENDNEFLKLAVQQHQQSNDHHPEYFSEGVRGMSESQLAEMVCDWYARSMEIGTDLRKWVAEVATQKYNFTLKSTTWKKIKKYIDLLLSPSIS